MAQSQTVIKSIKEFALLRSSRICRAFVLACVFLSFQSCARSLEQTNDSACQNFERALAGDVESECDQAKKKCLDELDQTIKDYTEQVQVLLTALGADTEREKVMRSAIAKLEKELSELKIKRERFNAAQCSKL
jgi:septal ring factor EnvC (AmiA/AmiB activator)